MFLISSLFLSTGVFLGMKFPIARFSKGYHPLITISVILIVVSLVVLSLILRGAYEPDLPAAIAIMGLCFASGYLAALAYGFSKFNDAGCFEEIHDALGEAIEELKKHEGHGSSTDLNARIKKLLSEGRR